MPRRGPRDEQRPAEMARVPLETVLGVFEDRDDRARPLTAGDVMDAVGCSRRTAHNKLNELVDRDVLATRKVGSRSRVWWVPLPRSDARRDVPDAPELLVESVDLPGSGRTLQARHRALLAAYEYLQEHPAVKKSDFIRDVFPEHTAEYESAEGWWNAVQPALAELPGVESPEERSHIWRFRRE